MNSARDETLISLKKRSKGHKLQNISEWTPAGGKDDLASHRWYTPNTSSSGVDQSACGQNLDYLTEMKQFPLSNCCCLLWILLDSLVTFIWTSLLFHVHSMYSWEPPPPQKTFTILSLIFTLYVIPVYFIPH